MKQNSMKQKENSIKTGLNAGFFKTELLAPAGNINALYGALNAGADAVYLGGDMFSARAFADNFDTDSLLKGIEYAHICNKKVYMTVNTLLKNKEIVELIEYLKPYYEAGLDGVIVQDFGVLKIISEAYPDLPLHASTQMAVSTVKGAEFLKNNFNVKRVVLARELTADEIREITNYGIETECFIHGSMCYGVSGQCLFSSMVGGRSGNRGRCAQSCRLPYKGEYNDKESYILSLKDMCTLQMLPDILGLNISSLKIEGRMKAPAYAAGVSGIYRKYIDSFYNNPEGEYSVSKEDVNSLRALYTRTDIQTGYYTSYRSKDMITFANPSYSKTDESYIMRLDEEFCHPRQAIKLDGEIIVAENKPLSLCLWDELGNVSQVEKGMCEKALNKPISKEDVIKAVTKTGEDILKINSVNCTINGNPFASIGMLKDIRRECLAQYKKNICRLRELPKEPDNLKWVKICNTSDRADVNDDYIVFADQLTALKTVIKHKFMTKCREICISMSVLRAILNGHEMIDKLSEYVIFVKLPEFIRKDMLTDVVSLIDRAEKNIKICGVYVNQTDSLELMLEYNRKNNSKLIIRADMCLYHFNNAAVMSMESFVDSYTASVELNKDELKHLKLKKAELMVYGRVPLMNTANCIRLSQNKCNGHRKTENNTETYIVDRLGQTEPVITHCDEKVCYNTIYNILPTCLLKNIDVIDSMGFAKKQIRFTVEKVSEINCVLDSFDAYDISAQFDYTNGHFKRGVE